jgi:hypothetical protein
MQAEAARYANVLQNKRGQRFYFSISQRFLTFPAELFEQVFKSLLPTLRDAWFNRNKRPLPESISQHQKIEI